MEDFDIPAVEAALSRLREIQAEVFGAVGHGFQMNPELPESEAASFERDHNIALPSDYRQFLTGIGNGGPGPFYGVFPLGFMDDNFDLRPWHGVVGNLLKPFPFQDEWNDLSGQPDADLLRRDTKEYDRQIDQFDARYGHPDL